MILARIAKALRDQNWLAVALEFFIVIAGVVIGFQITEWRARQADRDSEAIYLARLYDDMENSVCRISREADNVREWNERAQRTLDAFSYRLLRMLSRRRRIVAAVGRLGRQAQQSAHRPAAPRRDHRFGRCADVHLRQRAHRRRNQRRLRRGGEFHLRRRSGRHISEALLPLHHLERLRLLLAEGPVGGEHGRQRR